MIQKRTIRIATRRSPLALWQAHAVSQSLNAQGYDCSIVEVESSGDLQLNKPIYALGISGVFTKQLDTVLLNNEADIAVHSLKDVPTLLADGLVLAACLERGSWEDVVIWKENLKDQKGKRPLTIATSSLRRRAQWLQKFPTDKMVGIRGNLQTRLQKFSLDNSIDGVIFAKAGLERMDLLPEDSESLEWMLPAPAQGIIGIVCNSVDEEVLAICSSINHQTTYQCAWVERQFMRALQAGCSVPVSAYARFKADILFFSGAMHAFDGNKYHRVDVEHSKSRWKDAGQSAAEELLKKEGATELLKEIKTRKWDDESSLN